MTGTVSGRDSWDGGRIKEIRDERRLSQDDLAKAAKVSKSEIGRHERNAAVSNPTIDVLGRLARALKVPLPTLFESVGSPIPRPEEFGRARTVGHQSGGARIEDRLGDLLAYIKTLDGDARRDFIRAVVALLTALEHASSTASSGAAAENAR